MFWPVGIAAALAVACLVGAWRSAAGHRADLQLAGGSFTAITILLIIVIYVIK